MFVDKQTNRWYKFHFNFFTSQLVVFIIDIMRIALHSSMFCILFLLGLFAIISVGLSDLILLHVVSNLTAAPRRGD